MSSRCWYTRSLAYALADHCKTLWNGTPQNEWTCMGVYSDNSYGVQEGVFFSFPVFCKDKEYEIVQVRVLIIKFSSVGEHRICGVEYYITYLYFHSRIY